MTSRDRQSLNVVDPARHTPTSVDEAVENSDILLQSIRWIRQYHFELPRRNVRSTIPIAYLSWLRKRFQIDQVKLYLYARDGTLQGISNLGGAARLVGLPGKMSNDDLEQFIWRTFEDSRFIVARLESRNRKYENLDQIFGLVVLFRQEGFSPAQRAVLAEIVPLVGDYVASSTKVLILARIGALQKYLFDLSGTEVKPGTAVAISLAKIHDCLGAAYAFFATIHNGLLYLEYRRKPSSRGWVGVTLPDDEGVVMSPGFRELCARGEVFLWPMQSADSPLECFLPMERLSAGGARYFFLLAPVVIGADVVGIFVYALTKTSLFFDYPMSRVLLDLSVKLLAPAVRFLFQRRSRTMIVEPIFRGRDTRVKNNRVFVLMPFKEAWSNRIWEKLIRPICLERDLVSMRADDLFGRDIMEDIWEEICSARVVIADITGRNPNVFYELGIAHTLGKDVILLTQDVKDIPFDLNRYRHIIYQDNLDGYEILRRDLHGSLDALLSAE